MRQQSPSASARHLDRGRGLAYAAAFLVTVLWSSSFVFIKWGLVDIPPLFFATTRYALAFLILLAVEVGLASRRETRGHPPRKGQTALLVIAGVSGYTVAQGFQFVGLYYLPAVATSFVLNFTPFFALLIGVTTLGEGASLTQIGGLGLSLVGAYAFFSDRVAWGGQWLGVAVVVASGIGWAIYVVLVRAIQRDGAIDSLRLTTITMGVGVAGMAAMTAASGEYAGLTSSGLAIVIWLATANTAFAFFLWNWVLRAIPAYELTMLQDLMLIEIAVFAFLFLGEEITPLMLGGMALVLLGALAAQIRGTRVERAALRRSAEVGRTGAPQTQSQP